MWLRSFLPLALLPVLLPAIASAQVPAAYQATLVPLDFSTVALNNKGQVAGVVNDRIVIWEKQQGLTYLSDTGNDPYVSKLNDLGQVVGVHQGRGVLWQAGASPVILPQDWRTAFASDINNSGTMVGVWRGPMTEYGYDYTGFISRNGVMTPTDAVLGGDINEAGVVAGTAVGEKAMRWQNGVSEYLSSSRYSWAYAINDQGWIVGATSGPEFYPFATLWRNGAEEQMWPGYASGINNDGMAVGFSHDGKAMMWFDGQAHDLNALWDKTGWQGWELTHAFAVNNGGEILAEAKNVAGNGGYQYVLLSPVPEPASALLLLAGLALVYRRPAIRRTISSP